MVKKEIGRIPEISERFNEKTVAAAVDLVDGFFKTLTPKTDYTIRSGATNYDVTAKVSFGGSSDFITISRRYFLDQPNKTMELKIEKVSPVADGSLGERDHVLIKIQNHSTRREKLTVPGTSIRIPKTEFKKERYVLYAANDHREKFNGNARTESEHWLYNAQDNQEILTEPDLLNLIAKMLLEADKKIEAARNSN